MGAALCCVAGSPQLEKLPLHASGHAPPDNLVSISTRREARDPRHDDIVSPAEGHGPAAHLDHPVVMASLWPHLERASKATLRRACKHIRLAVDCNLLHVSSPCITDCLTDSSSAHAALAASSGRSGGSGRSRGSSRGSSHSHSHPHFPSTWSHIKTLTLKNMHDVNRIFAMPPRPAPHLALSSLQTVTLVLDKCTQSQLRRVMKLPIAARVTHIEMDSSKCLSGALLLVGCPNLRHLSITENTWDNRWKDASVDQCTQLSSLRIRSGFLSVLPVTAAWSHLADVDVSNCRSITSLLPLSDCTSLRSLDISCTAVRDLAPLHRCTSLATLNARRCRHVTSLTPLAHCTALTALDASWTGISDLIPLAGLALLQKLNVASTSVSDLTPLRLCAKLQELDTALCERLQGLAALGGSVRVDAWAAKDMSPPPPSQLCWLDISSCCSAASLGGGNRPAGSRQDIRRAGSFFGPDGVAAAVRATAMASDGEQLRWDLSSLADCVALETLAASRNAFSDLGPLARCTSLVSLDISRCRGVACLIPLAGCTALATLDISWTSVSDLAPLAGHRQLSRLDASHCAGVCDLAPLASCTALQQLLLRECSLLEDLSPLASCGRLALLNVTRCNRIVDLSSLERCGLRGRGRLLVGDDQHILYWELKAQYPHY